MSAEEGRSSTAVVLYVIAVAVVGVPLLGWGIVASDDGTFVVTLVAAAALVELFPARLRPNVTLSLLPIVTIAGLLLEGVPAAVASCLGAAALSLFRAHDRRVLRATFNASQKAVAALAAGVVFEALSNRADGLEGIVNVRSLGALLVAVLVNEAVGHLLVSGIVSLDSGEELSSVLRDWLLPTLLLVPYSALAVLAAVLVLDVGTQALFLMIIPALVARTGLLAFQRVDEAYERLVRSFAKTIEAKDEYTKGHSERVSYLSDLVAGDLRVGYEERRLVRYAAMLHDVGKIGVPLCIINKPGPLDDLEFQQMKAHPVIGENILRDIDFLLPVLDVVRHHHERLDGRGYPDGLAAEDLSEAVRIVTVVDAFDAMTSTRAYRRSMSVEDAMAEMRRCSGSQFDRRIVAALEVVVKRIGWEPTMAWSGDLSEIPDVTHVPPLTERHDFRIGDEGVTTEFTA